MKQQDKILLTALGDIMTSDSPIYFGFGARSYLENNSLEAISEQIKQAIPSSDIVIANLEVPISPTKNKLSNYKTERFLGFSRTAELLKKANINVVNIANNHILEHGDLVFEHTIKQLQENKIKIIGIQTPNGLSMPATIRIKDCNIKIFGFSFRPEIFNPNQNKYSHINHSDQIINSIKHYSDKNSINIISLHWGEEFIKYPSKEQKEFAKRLSKNNVSLILGHHPHTLQPIEQFEKCVTAYSLGNFYSDMHRRLCRESIAIQFSLRKNEAPSIHKINYLLINKWGIPRNAQSSTKRKIEKILFCKNYKELNIKNYMIIARSAEKINSLINRLYFFIHFLKYSNKTKKQAISIFFQRRIKK